MQGKIPDKSLKTAELDDAALNGVVGGTSIGPMPTGPVYVPVGGGGGGGGGPGPSGPKDGGGAGGHPSGPFEPNTINFPK